MQRTARLKLPLLVTGQAQKEVTHNEALILLDLLVAPSGSGPANVAPSAPPEGSVHICGPTPSGEWEGRAHHLAIWIAAGWRFAAPFEGQKFVEASSGQEWQFRGGTWVRGVVLASELRVNGNKVIGSQRQAIANASGGSTVDTEARTVLAAILDALRGHGLIAT